MKAALLTGGGDCSSLNAAIRAVAKSLVVNYDAEIIGIEDGFLGLIERRVRSLDTEHFDGLIHEGGTILGTCNRASPTNYKGRDLRQEVHAYYQQLGLDCIIALGGDGTMSLCHELAQTGMNFIGIPKTIDNDLPHTDRTFGFDSAVSIVTEAIDRLQTTARSHHRVMIVETMGRYAGWIALYGGVSGDADVILIPEYPYHVEEVISVIHERRSRNKHTIIVVAEGATAADSGETIVSKTIADSPDPIRLGGVGRWLQNEIEKQLDDVEVRTTVLGHTQRGGPPTSFDRIFATNLGCYAATLVGERKFNTMACVRDNQMYSVPLSKVANNTRTVTADDMTLLSAMYCGISFGVPGLKEKVLKNAVKTSPHLR